ncbi:MAG TPA: RDD family protein [Casimicrobium sp.]|nr:RDD family protein [Casimicrobium sp.]
MRSSSIYEALELSPTSPTDEIQASLRSVLRRFWAVPRDASGDTEEAVRFAALAASILVDPIRRKDYDAALSPGVGSGPWRLPVGGGRDTTGEASQSGQVGDAAMEGSRLSTGSTTPKLLPGVNSLADPLPEASAWSSPWIYLLAIGAWLLLWGAFVQPFDKVPELSFAHASVVALIVALLICLTAMWVSQTREVPVSAASLSRLAVIKWRREGSIFLGVPAPQHDIAWIFKLRLMELTRSTAGYVTATSVWRRVAARLFDYALVGLLVYGLIAVAEAFAPSLHLWWVALRSPVVLPVLVVLAAMPLEAFLTQRFRTTCGKWLFGMVVVTGASRPADHAHPNAMQLAWARARRVAWVGSVGGFWPLALARLKGVMQDAREQETVWDASGDAVIMARPMAVTTVSAALMVLAAAVVILGTAWRDDFNALKPHISEWGRATASGGADVKASAERALMGIVSSMPGQDRAKNTPPPASVATDVSPKADASTAANVDAPTKPKAVPSQRSTPTATSEEATIARLSAEANQRRVRIDGYIQQSEAARRTGNFAAVQGVCQRWSVDQPSSAQAWQCLGLAQYQNGAGRDALPALRQSLKLQGHDPAVEAAILKILRP